MGGWSCAAAVACCCSNSAAWERRRSRPDNGLIWPLTCCQRRWSSSDRRERTLRLLVMPPLGCTPRIMLNRGHALVVQTVVGQLSLQQCSQIVFHQDRQRTRLNSSH